MFSRPNTLSTEPPWGEPREVVTKPSKGSQFLARVPCGDRRMTIFIQRKFPALQPALHSSPYSKTASQDSKRHAEDTLRCWGDGFSGDYITSLADVCASISNLECGTTAGSYNVTNNKVLYCGFVLSHKFSRANDNASARVQSLPAKVEHFSD